jgi:hypothetical protein
MNSMTYEAARDHIKNGDIVHVYKKHGWHGIETLVHGLIKLVTGSPIFHNVVAMWMDTPNGEKRLMCVESNIRGGKRIVPLSYYEGYKLEIHPLPATVDFEYMEPVLMRKVNQQPYGILDFIHIGLWELFHIKSRDFKGQVCSELCAEAWTAGGIGGLTPSWRVSPVGLREALVEQGIHPTITIEQP